MLRAELNPEFIRASRVGLGGPRFWVGKVVPSYSGMTPFAGSLDVVVRAEARNKMC
jgi:hypothetical protein